MKIYLGMLMMIVLVYGQGSNLVVNGNFEVPALSSGWRILQSMPGWKGNEFEQGFGNIYNRRWGNLIVYEIDGNQNNVLYQEFNLRAGTYEISFRYAARENLRQGVGLQTSQMSVYWNGQRIDFLAPANFEIHTYRRVVQAQNGINKLEFRGEGTSDCLGMTFREVALREDLICEHCSAKPSFSQSNANFYSSWNQRCAC